MITAIVDLTVEDYGNFKRAYADEKPTYHHIVELAMGQSTETPGNVFVILQMQEAEHLLDFFADSAMHPILEEAKVKLGITQLNGITFLN